MSFENIETKYINWVQVPSGGTASHGPLNTVEVSNGSGGFLNSGILAGPAPIILITPPDFGQYIDMNPSTPNSDLVAFVNQTPSLMPNLMALGVNALMTGTDDFAILNGATAASDLIISNNSTGGVSVIEGETVGMVNSLNSNVIVVGDTDISLVLQGGVGSFINIQDNVNFNQIQSTSAGISLIFANGLSIQTNGNPCVININVLGGKHAVKGEFMETPLRLFSDFISLFSIFWG